MFYIGWQTFASQPVDAETLNQDLALGDMDTGAGVGGDTGVHGGAARSEPAGLSLSDTEIMRSMDGLACSVRGYVCIYVREGERERERERERENMIYAHQSMCVYNIRAYIHTCVCVSVCK